MPKSITITEEDRLRYRTEGYHIIPQVIPPSLLKDLRREAAKAREIAWRVSGPQAQRLYPLKEYAGELDIQTFNAINEIEGLNEALCELLTPRHWLKPTEDGGILFSPRDRPWSTEWHRDWRDHVPEDAFLEHVGSTVWEKVTSGIEYWNQINCPLYEDTSTWYLPGSSLRQENTPEELAHYTSATQEELRDRAGKKTDEELELFCLRYCQRMPGSVQLVLNPGDFCIYRNTGWHLGNYVPYRERMTIHTHCMTPEFQDFCDRYLKLIDVDKAAAERHSKVPHAKD